MQHGAQRHPLVEVGAIDPLEMEPRPTLTKCNVLEVQAVQVELLHELHKGPK
jgi:hypothetical protein